MSSMLGPEHARWLGLSSRRAAAFAVIVASLVGCGTTEKASRETLPPIATTTSTTTIPGTTIPAGVRQVWIVESGDTLASIAAATGSTVALISELNGIDNPDSIQAGQTIEIPAGVLVLNSPGGAAADTTTTVATLDGG